MSFIYNGRMFRGTQNLKDSSHGSGLMVKDNFFHLSYNKTNKLIAGLYMVTDILDKDEPIRNRLRILGTGVISDISSSSFPVDNLNAKISEILSFLDIASSVGIISQMNSSILKKEFSLLQESIGEATQESRKNSITFNGQATLSEFMKEDVGGVQKINRTNTISIGHSSPTRIGVQKGHTLMKALSDKMINSPVGRIRLPDNNSLPQNVSNFNNLKKERREKIVNIVRNNPNGASIKDIALAIHNIGEDMGEKTLQRELISMVQDRVLNKTGEKRWSRYFLAN